MPDSSYDENKDSAGLVLKTDVLGRVKTGARQREAMLEEFERSGLSGTKFAVAGVDYQTFASWAAEAQKRRKATGAHRVHGKGGRPGSRRVAHPPSAPDGQGIPSNPQNGGGEGS